MRLPVAIVLMFLFASVHLRAQVDFSGMTSVDLLKSAPTQAPRWVNEGRPTFAWRADLFLNGIVSDNVAVLSNVRIDSTERLFFDYFAIRVTHISPLDVNFQVGKFDMPFGNLGERRFPRYNALYDLPLIYEYRTAAPNYPLSNTGQLEYWRGRGLGLRLLDGGIYDVGAMVYGSFDIFTYAFALSNGTLSTAAYGTENLKDEFGKVARVTATPATGLTIGLGYAWGAYLPNAVSSANVDFTEYQQKDAELDVAFSRGHLVFYGEIVHATWETPVANDVVDLGALGYYAEAKYTLMPRVYAALRVNGLQFENVQYGGYSMRWDYNVAEVEAGLGYFIDRNVLFKLVRRETRTYGGTYPKDNLTVGELAVSF